MVYEERRTKMKVKGLIAIGTLGIMLTGFPLMGNAEQNINLTPDGKVPGSPFQNLQNQIDGVKGDVSTLQTDVGTLQSDVGSLQTNVGTLQTDVSTLNSVVGGNTADIGALQADTSALQTDIGKLQNGQIDRIPLWTDTDTLGNSVILQDSSTDNVGIRSTTPEEILHLGQNNTNSMLRIETDNATSGVAGVNFYEEGSPKWSMGLRALDNNFYIGQDDQYFVATPRMVIHDDGNVAIGTTNPRD